MARITTLAALASVCALAACSKDDNRGVVANDSGGTASNTGTATGTGSGTGTGTTTPGPTAECNNAADWCLVGTFELDSLLIDDGNRSGLRSPPERRR